MKDRIKKIRKELDLTQQKFADKLGVKRNTVGQWECGINALTDQTITAICREFNVNEAWLREGKGDIFILKTRNQIITDFVNDLMDEPDSFKTRFIEGMSKLDESDWEDIEKIILKITTNKTEKKQITNFTDDIPDTAEEFEKMYPPVKIDTNKKKNIG